MGITDPDSIPLEKLLNQISGKWTIYILWILDTNGKLRFGELKRKIDGISTKVLTERLQLLESIGIIDRHYKPTIPPQVTYELTDRGKQLSQPLYHLCDLATNWYGDDLM
ncbi:helix-turn-helix domain-containing protein [Chamaesiphon sp. VAR_48_metabat_135_sub]|uniref:winged helix-turn-helix transcriptional regulator n=1 Tax=Chamaesiphon sp. VAR_48_metabat_135_sub TaxID=2964699 RepID=UPI00286AA683|nr:helix-turn-helix domain-containing protein [Chamaesiphon sp. VAR_48_metabat_135_sub]